MVVDPSRSAHGRAVAIAVSVLALLLSPSLLVSQAGTTYDRATVDEAGQLHILTADQREIVPPKDTDQVGFSLPAISEDREAVGWLALYPNCCTSYPIPLKLVVYAKGQVHTFTGADLPVWKWRFEAGGAQVAFEQETVHGGFGVHYELRDIASDRLLDQFEPTDSGPLPGWVRALEATQ